MSKPTQADVDCAQSVMFAVEVSPEVAAMQVAVYRLAREKAARDRVLSQSIRLLEARRAYVLADMARCHTKDDSYDGGRADALFQAIVALGAFACEP
jgi:hypothetical protein